MYSGYFGRKSPCHDIVLVINRHLSTIITNRSKSAFSTSIVCGYIRAFTFQRIDTLDRAFQIIKSMLQRDIMKTNLNGTEKVLIYIDVSKYEVCIC